MAKSNINFEDFTNATLSAAARAMTDNPKLFPDPEITVGIVIRRNYRFEVPELGRSPIETL